MFALGAAWLALYVWTTEHAAPLVTFAACAVGARHPRVGRPGRASRQPAGSRAG